MATPTPRQLGIIPHSVLALLDFHIRGYYKNKVDESQETSTSRYIRSLEQTVVDLKEVVRGLYQEREAAARVIEHYVEKWNKGWDDDKDLEELAKLTQNDPPEHVPGL